MEVGGFSKSREIKPKEKYLVVDDAQNLIKVEQTRSEQARRVYEALQQFADPVLNQPSTNKAQTTVPAEITEEYISFTKNYVKERIPGRISLELALVIAKLILDSEFIDEINTKISLLDPDLCNKITELFNINYYKDTLNRHIGSISAKELEGFDNLDIFSVYIFSISISNSLTSYKLIIDLTLSKGNDYLDQHIQSIKQRQNSSQP